MGLITNFERCFEAIGDTSKKAEKEQHLQDFLDGADVNGQGQEAYHLLYFMFSGTVTFGISALPAVGYMSGSRQLKFSDVAGVLNSLRTRALSGDRAKKSLCQLVDGACEEDISAMMRIIRKDPKCGFTIKSANKILEPKIPIFEQQKPLSLNEDVGKGLKEINWDLLPKLDSYMVEIKYDGNRCYLIVPKGKAAYFVSAKGFEILSMKTLAGHLQELYNLNEIVLDGELFYQSIEETGSIVRKITDQGLETGITFFVMGAMHHTEWIASFKEPTTIKNKVFRKRASLVLKQKEPSVHIRMTACKVVSGDNSLEMMQTMMTASLDRGFEGLVIKDPESCYSRYKESRDGWWKAKFIDFYDAPIVGFQEGEGKNLGKLGAFIVEYKGVKSNVGGSFKDPKTKISSLDDAKRLEYYINRDDYMGKVIRIVSYGLTTLGKFRHAALHSFHDEK